MLNNNNNLLVFNTLPGNTIENINFSTIDIIEELAQNISDQLVDNLFDGSQDLENENTPATRDELLSIVPTIKSDNETCKCSICQDDIKSGEYLCKMPCGCSCYHYDCLMNWLKIDNSCPCCRQPIKLGGNYETEYLFNEDGSANNNIIYLTINFPDGSVLYKSFNKNIILGDFLDKIKIYLSGGNMKKESILLKNTNANILYQFSEIRDKKLCDLNFTNKSQIAISNF